MPRTAAPTTNVIVCDRNEVLTEIAITELTITRPPDRRSLCTRRPSPLVADQAAYCDATRALVRGAPERRTCVTHCIVIVKGSPLIFAKWVNRTLVKRGAGMP